MIATVRGNAATIKQQLGNEGRLEVVILDVTNEAGVETTVDNAVRRRDTLAMFKEKMDRFNADIETWHDTIVGTDHDDVKA